MSHGKELNTSDVLAVLWEVGGAELFHEFNKGQVKETVTFNRKPVLKASEDFVDLVVLRNIFVLEIAQAGHLK